MFKRIFFSFVLFASGFLAAPAYALELGERLPDVDLPGNAQSLLSGKQQGKVLYVDFWASWCGPCRQSFPWMNAMQEKYKAQGLEIIGVNLDAQAADAEKFLAKVPAHFTLAYDPQGKSANAFGIKGMPTSFLIGRDGKVVSTHMGFNEGSREALEQQIKAALESRK